MCATSAKEIEKRDLAVYVAKHEYLVISVGKEKPTGDQTRHLLVDMPSGVQEVPTEVFEFVKSSGGRGFPTSLLKFVKSCGGRGLPTSSFKFVESRGGLEVPTSFLEFEKLRTMLLLNNEFVHVTNHSVFDLVGSKLKCLRVLNLNAAGISKIPKNIGKLKHLRFLDLSRNHFRRVPEAITRLHNLQTLDLCENDCLLELPRYISKLVSLKHLYITGCWHLEWMPRGLGQLTSLQTLTNFVVAEQEMPGSVRISELGKLNNLSGTLTITWLSRLRSNHKEAESVKLGEKQHLQQLLLFWGPLHIYDSPKVGVEDELILERLRPHHTVKSLCIKGFCGERLPEWIGGLLELQHLLLLKCEYLTSLPEGLHNLTSLRTLTIYDSPSLPGDERQKVAHIPCMNLLSLDEFGQSELSIFRLVDILFRNLV